MSDQVIIVLIIAVAVVIVLLIFRNKLRRFVLKIMGIEATLEIPERTTGVTIKQARQNGTGHEIKTERDNVNISDVKQNGNRHKIIVKKNSS